jgi:hypothetical protein
VSTPAFLDPGHRFAGWIAIVGSVFAWLSVYCLYAATAGDLDAVLHPATALGLDAMALQRFRLAMLADILGFYLAVLIVGGYLWSSSRYEVGALTDIAVLALLVYVVLGISGASMQLAALPALAEAHGLWWAEGPVMGLWTLLLGPILRRQRRAYSSLLMVCGVLYLMAFGAEFLGIRAVAELCETLGVLLLPLWLLLTGIALVRVGNAGLRTDKRAMQS